MNRTWNIFSIEMPLSFTTHRKVIKIVLYSFFPLSSYLSQNFIIRREINWDACEAKKFGINKNICWKLHAIVRLKLIPKFTFWRREQAPGTTILLVHGEKAIRCVKVCWRSFHDRRNALVWSSQCSAHTYNFSFLLFTFELFLVSHSHECVPTKSLC